MKLSCEIVRDLLPLVLDGAAGKESSALVKEHLKECPECRGVCRKMRSELIGGCADECDEDAAQLMKRMRTENTLKNLTIFINVMTIMIELCTIVQMVKKISRNKNSK